MAQSPGRRGPHFLPYRLTRQIQTGDTRAGQITLSGTRLQGFGDLAIDRPNDGLAVVTRYSGPDGQLARLRVNLSGPHGTQPQTLAALMSSTAEVSRMIWDELESARFAERQESYDSHHSGWALTAGVESDEYLDDLTNFHLIPLHTIVQQVPAIKRVVTAEPGSRLPLKDGTYVAT